MYAFPATLDVAPLHDLHLEHLGQCEAIDQ